VTPARFWIAAALFHAAVVVGCGCVLRRWRDPARRAMGERGWWRAAAVEIAALAAFTYLVSVVATFLANTGYGRRVLVGEISLRLNGQALFGEAILLGLAGGWLSARWGRRPRAAALVAAALGLGAVYVEAYRLEPTRLRLRRHLVDLAGPAEAADTIRILHLTDIQTPAIGAHEARALGAGLAAAPHLIVLTGDYVQDELGRPTERQAVRDLQALMARIRFRAPLGVFATDGDAGPRCRDVFAGTPVRCLVDESAVVPLPAGGTLKVTGLGRGRGRERNAARLAAVLDRGPAADHHIVISHAPDFVDVAPSTLDLVLAGHTHGGQVVLPLIGPPRTAMRLPRRYAGGLHDYEGIPLHVSRGVGMERGFAPPVRFLCPPEVCLLDLRLPARRGGPGPRSTLASGRAARDRRLSPSPPPPAG
jgi:predicted MPP superfamily phosphohydrolase